MKELALRGKNILITRPTGQEGELVRALEERGARPIHLPLIRIEPPSSWESLDQALGRMNEFSWVIFTSANGVAGLISRRNELRSSENWGKRGERAPRFCAIGKKTAAALKKEGLPVDLIPESFTSEGLLEALRLFSWKGEKVLLVQAQEGRELIGKELRDWGAQLHVAAAYRTVPDASAAQELKVLLQREQIDWILFASPSAVKAFANALGEKKAKELASSLHALAIGPATAAELIRIGFTPVVAREHTGEGIISTLEEFTVSDPLKRGSCHPPA